ncbi:MAG: leucine-rich repeat domain-containing protein, partial [Clostridiales bacterium]|nr:leucine-rich repeat domain-containing protein [Clostridiales bacterium]
MKHTCKRLTALVLALAMCFSLLAPAWAADVEAEEEVSAEVVTEDTEEVAVEETEEPSEGEAEAEEPVVESAEAAAEVSAAEVEEEEPAEDEGDAVVSAQAASSGTCGANLTWTYSSGTLTISGTGDMTDWSSSSNVPWYSSYHTSITQVVIKSGVTSIGDYAFRNCSSLTSVTIP